VRHHIVIDAFWDADTAADALAEVNSQLSLLALAYLTRNPPDKMVEFEGGGSRGAMKVDVHPTAKCHGEEDDAPVVH